MDTLRKARWLAPLALATACGVAGLVPKPAHAQDAQWMRVTVDAADVVVRGGQPYYRYGGYRDSDRIIVGRDRDGRPVYYRIVDLRDWRDRDQNRYGDRRHHRRHYRAAWPAYTDDYNPTARRVTCNKYGNCTVTWYDPRYRP